MQKVSQCMSWAVCSYAVMEWFYVLRQLNSYLKQSWSQFGCTRPAEHPEVHMSMITLIRARSNAANEQKSDAELARCPVTRINYVNQSKRTLLFTNHLFRQKLYLYDGSCCSWTALSLCNSAVVLLVRSFVQRLQRLELLMSFKLALHQ